MDVFQRDGNFSAGEQHARGTAPAQRGHCRLQQHPPLFQRPLLDGGDAGHDPVAHFLRLGYDAGEPRSLKPLLVKAGLDRAAGRKQAYAYTRRGLARHRLAGGIGDVEHDHPGFTLQRVVPKMRGIARHGDAGRAGLSEYSQAAQQLRQGRLALAQDAARAIGYLRHRVDDQRQVILIALRRRLLDDFGHEIDGRHGPHAAEDSDHAVWFLVCHVHPCLCCCPE